MADAQRVARSHGVEFLIWDAARSLERQHALYRQGRVEPGQVVTLTIASNHLWGTAIDLTIRRGSGPSWDFPRWYHDEVLPLARRHRLDSLRLRFGIDPPHFEVPREELPPSITSAANLLKQDFPGVA